MFVGEGANYALLALRAAFPNWGFVFDPWRNQWLAVRGNVKFFRADTAALLSATLVNDESYGAAI
jgi:hypothetical protein